MFLQVNNMIFSYGVQSAQPVQKMHSHTLEQHISYSQQHVLQECYTGTPVLVCTKDAIWTFLTEQNTPEQNRPEQQ